MRIYLNRWSGLVRKTRKGVVLSQSLVRTGVRDKEGVGVLSKILVRISVRGKEEDGVLYPTLVGTSVKDKEEVRSYVHRWSKLV